MPTAGNASPATGRHQGSTSSRRAGPNTTIPRRARTTATTTTRTAGTACRHDGPRADRQTQHFGPASVVTGMDDYMLLMVKMRGDELMREARRGGLAAEA